jgi:hypothetical protein
MKVDTVPEAAHITLNGRCERITIMHLGTGPQYILAWSHNKLCLTYAS